MKKIFFTPGPSQLYPTAIAHFQKGFDENVPSLSHRSKQFSEIYQGISEKLKKLLSIPEGYHIFIVGSGTEAMERAIQNCVEKYSFHFVNGSFSKRFFATAQELCKKPDSIQVPLGQGFDFTSVAIPKKTELICFTHSETSAGVMLPEKAIEAVAKKYPEMLIAVDAVSSAPYGDFNYRLLDVVFFSVQKLFGLPAGLGVMIVSPRAIKKAEKLMEKGISIGSYHSFLSLFKSSEKWQTPETPPILEMYILEKVVTDMLAKGIETIKKETEEKAKLLYDFIDAHEIFSAFIEDKAFRSQTVIVADVQKAKVDVKKNLSQKGFIVGSGYGEFKEKHIRIANFPAHSVQDMKNLISVLKTF